jgi:hypothetical protein
MSRISGSLGKRPGERYALHHAAGELLWISVLEALKPDFRQELARDPRAFARY